MKHVHHDNSPANPEVKKVVYVTESESEGAEATNVKVKSKPQPSQNYLRVFGHF